MTLSLPTPDGPESTISRAAGRASSLLTPLVSTPRGSLARRELPKQCSALLFAEAAQPAAVSDLQLFHYLSRPNLADTGQRLEHGRHLQLADDIVGLGAVEHLGEARLTALELFLQLGAGLANF